MSIPDPVVLLDARARYVHPAFQMTRASTQTVFDSTGRLVTVPANAIGWDHDPATGQARGYLAEPSATNLLTYSNSFGDWPTSFGIDTVQDGAAIGPDGAQSLAKLVESSSEGVHLVRNIATIPTESVVCYSAFLRAGERTITRLYAADDNDTSHRMSIDVDLLNGEAVSTAQAGDAELISYGVEPVSPGLFRLWLAGTLGTTTTARVNIYVGNASYEGDGTSGLYAGFAQAELGRFPTSYTPTDSTTTVRDNNNLILPSLGDFPWWRADQGTMLIATRIGSVESFDIGRMVEIGTSLRLSRRAVNNDLRMGGDMTDTTDILTAAQSAGRHIAAFTWDLNNVVCAVDGVIRADVPALAPMPANPTLGIACATTYTSGVGGYQVERAVHYPQRVSNADLQSLTAIQE